MLQLLHSPLILHELLLLLEHLRKAAGRLEVQGDFSGLFRRFFRFGLGLIFLCGAVVLCRQVELVVFLVQPGTEPALWMNFRSILRALVFFLCVRSASMERDRPLCQSKPSAVSA